jgi:VIT1/CCC1 family predicted Fe2+/Mn2+ transporter
LLSFLSTFPVIVPFLFFSDARLGLRVSNAVGIAMLFLCGFIFGRYAGFRPMGLSMIALGSAFVGVAIALGG